MSKKDKHKKRRLRWFIVGAVVAGALLLGWCGRGWFGGGSSGDDKADKDGKVRPAMAVPADAGKAPRCRLRVDETGVKLNGSASSVEAAVKACGAGGEAELIATGLAKYGTVDALKKALNGAGVRIYEVGAKTPVAP